MRYINKNLPLIKINRDGFYDANLPKD